jgi:hypothetical protein
VLAVALVKGVATVYRDGVAILTTSKMPQSSKTYAKLLNYLQSNTKTDKVGEYGQILARNVRTGLGTYPGPQSAPSPTPTPVPTPVPVPVPQPGPQPQTLGVGGIVTPPLAIVATSDTTAPLTLTKAGVYDGQGHTVGRITLAGDNITVQNYRVKANGQYGFVSDGENNTIQNCDIKDVKPSGDGDLNALSWFGNEFKFLYNTVENFVSGPPGDSHTDGAQTWVSSSHPVASSNVEFRGNRFSGPANPKRDSNVPSIHQCIMAEDYNRGGNKGGDSSGMKNWLIADNYFEGSWNQEIKLDGVDNVDITRNVFAGSSDKIMDVPQGSNVRFWADNKITGSYKNGVGIPITPGTGPGEPAPATPPPPADLPPTEEPPPVTDPVPTSTTVTIIRHAEKPTGSLKGFDGAKVNDHALIIDGWARAGALVGFARSGRVPVPDALFASQGSTASRRPSETLAYVAKDRKLTVNIQFDAETALTAMVNAVKAKTGNTWVALEHSMIQAFVKAFGVSIAAWDDARFDVALVLTKLSNGTWTLAQVPQNLLPGDKNTAL